MDPALAPGASPKPAVFHDGLGERRRISDVSGADTIEQLCLRSELTAIPSFEFALRERASRLANFRNPTFARVRSVDRLTDPSSTLAVVSESVKGVRLANLLAANERRPLTLDINASLHLVRQLVAAVAVLHESARDVAHGAIGPERIIVTSNARVVLVEYVLGAALEQLRYSRERYWKELRVALPPPPAFPHIDHRADVNQIGVTALSLVIGRLLHDDEYPEGAADVLELASAISANGEHKMLPDGLRSWIGRALQLDPHKSFANAVEARDDLERVLSETDDETDDLEEADEPVFVQPPASVVPAAAERIEAAFVEPPKAEVAKPEPFKPEPIKPEPIKSEPVKVEAVKVEAAKPQPPKSEPAKIETPRTAPAADVRAEQTASPASTASGKSGWVRADSASEPVPTRFEPRDLDTFAPATAAKPAASFPAPAAASSHASSYAPLPEVEDEEEDAAPAESKPGLAALVRQPWNRAAVAAVALVILSTAGVLAVRKFAGGSSAPATGSLNINSNPVGAQVFVDGQASGVTPITLTLKAGAHNVELRGAGEPRAVPVTITAGTQISQYIELPSNVTAFGQLQVKTEPAGAQVTVDGIPRGKSPVLVESLAAGDHTVVLERDGANVKHNVSVEAGMTASLVVPMAASAAAEPPPVSGWIAVTAPVELQLFENKKLIGTSQSDRVMVGAGKHEIEIVNEALGFRATRSVQVSAGKMSPLKLEWPKGTIAINALPWAEVWIDGERVGETPIGNLSLPIGPHELVFRHPDLGEQRYATTVSLKEPARVSVDLRKK